MSRPASLGFFLTTAFVLAGASGVHAQDPAPGAFTPTFASGSAPASVATPDPTGVVTRAQFVDALSQGIGFVGALRSWRETLRGSGNAPRRELWSGSLGSGQVALALGQVRAPDGAGFAAGAGTAFSWANKSGQRFDGGTTARPQQLDKLLQGFDAQMSATPNSRIKDEAALDRASVTWLRAKPVSNGEAELEATWLRAGRDEQTGAGGRWRNATFADVNARLSLPLGWQARGSWLNARFDGQSDRASWNAAANGFLPHPWGRADVKLDWKTTDAGFATFAGVGAAGEQAGAAQVSQTVQTPLVSGTLVAAASTHSLDQTAGARPGDELAREESHAGADLKLQLAPALALTATGNASQVGVERASSPDVVAPARESLRSAGGDVGMDWKVSKQLSLGAGAGMSRTQTDMAGDGHGDGHLENRASVRLRFARDKENYALALQMRDRNGAGQNQSPDATRWAHLAALQLETERPLVGDWRLKASANWMIDREAAPGNANGVARQIVAGLQFARAARLDVRYRDGAALPFALSSDPMGGVFASPGFTGGNRQISTRFNVGSAAGSSGLGLAVEWARQNTFSGRGNTWKIGLSFR